MQVLENSIERISYEKKAGFEDIRDIFEDEFSKSVLNGDEETVKSCGIRNGKAVLEIKRKSGRKLASVEIKIKNGSPQSQ